ncbi:MAG: hypothetical protein HYY35_07550 [Deltaproteobacteria bacterium]|nr:hypothetical protein [Deltaproteobacteria bacterium]
MLLALALLTAYIGWHTMPLAQRLDVLERDRLELRDRLLAEIEKLHGEIDGLRVGLAPLPRPPDRSPSEGSSRVEGRGDASSSSPTSASPAPAPQTARVDLFAAERFLSRRLFPEDTSLALAMLEGLPPAEIARRSRHSLAYVNAKGVQIERQLAAAPDTPPEILAAIRAAVARARKAE